MNNQLVAHCIKLKYEASVNELVPSYDKKDPGFLRRMEKAGFNVWHRGTGWAEISKPSQLILTVKIGRSNKKIDIAPFFRKVLGRVTKKRGEKLSEVMPKEISVIQTSDSYQVLGTELQAWLGKAKLNI